MEIMTIVHSHHELKIDLDKVQKFIAKKTFGLNIIGRLDFRIFSESFVVTTQKAFNEFEELAIKCNALISKT